MEERRRDFKFDEEQMREHTFRLHAIRKAIDRQTYAIHGLSENLGKWLALLAGADEEQIREMTEKLKASSDKLEKALDEQS